MDFKTKVPDYLILTAFGILLTGFAYATPIIFATYPPFGLAGHSFLTLASYLFTLGIYSSAISAGEDENLRYTLKRLAIEESKVIDSIGTATMEQKIQKKVLSLTKAASDAMTEQTGIQPSLSEEEMKNYLEEVLIEIRGKSRK